MFLVYFRIIIIICVFVVLRFLQFKKFEHFVKEFRINFAVLTGDAFYEKDFFYMQ